MRRFRRPWRRSETLAWHEKAPAGPSTTSCRLTSLASFPMTSCELEGSSCSPQRPTSTTTSTHHYLPPPAARAEFERNRREAAQRAAALRKHLRGASVAVKLQQQRFHKLESRLHEAMDAAAAQQVLRVEEVRAALERASSEHKEANEKVEVTGGGVAAAAAWVALGQLDAVADASTPSSGGQSTLTMATKHLKTLDTTHRMLRSALDALERCIVAASGSVARQAANQLSARRLEQLEDVREQVAELEARCERLDAVPEAALQGSTAATSGKATAGAKPTGLDALLSDSDDEAGGTLSDIEMEGEEVAPAAPYARRTASARLASTLLYVREQVATLEATQERLDKAAKAAVSVEEVVEAASEFDVDGVQDAIEGCKRRVKAEKRLRSCAKRLIKLRNKAGDDTGEAATAADAATPGSSAQSNAMNAAATALHAALKLRHSRHSAADIDEAIEGAAAVLDVAAQLREACNHLVEATVRHAPAAVVRLVVWGGADSDKFL